MALMSPRPNSEEKARFVMSFVKQSDELRNDMLDIWEETFANYFVLPNGVVNFRTRTDRPLQLTQTPATRAGAAVLKDPESHQIVETYLAKLWNSLFGEPGFIDSKPVGIEDAEKGELVSRLLEYCLNIHGHPRTFYQWIKDGLIFGTGIIEAFWMFEEDTHEVREVNLDLFTGEEIFSTVSTIMPIYDDVRLRNIDILDFYPDPGSFRLEHMRGACKRFVMSSQRAMRMARRGAWDLEETRLAVDRHQSEQEEDADDQSVMDDIRVTEKQNVPSEFKPVVGFEYWGEFPWKTELSPNRRGVLTVLNGQLVQERPWPLSNPRLPFYDVTVNPVTGRFYGYGPLEAARHDQDFADVLKRMIADAVVRGTRSMPLVRRDARVDSAKLRNFSPDVPIYVDGDPGGAVGYLNYRPPVEGAINMYATVKNQLREQTGALGAIQGHGLGSKRFSATEAQQTFAQAFDRPEMIALLIERDSLPPIGKGILSFYQRFIDSEGLARRVGERPTTGAIADILHDFDVRFVGSRRQHDRQSKIAALERFVSVIGSIPPIAALIPWQDFLQEYVRALDLPKMEARIADALVVAQNTSLQQQLGANAQNNNGAVNAAGGGDLDAQRLGRASGA